MNEAADEIATGAQVELSNVYYISDFLDSVFSVSSNIYFDLYSPYECSLVSIIYLSTLIAVNTLFYA